MSEIRNWNAVQALDRLRSAANFIPFTRLDLLVLFLTAAVGTVYIPYPFMGDQANFLIGAARLNHGGVLYRDFSDIKQPGIFFFYWLGGKLFGFSEAGVHALELLYLLAFSLALILILRDHYQNRWVASLTPLLTVAYYYLATDIWHRTQIEALVGFPLFLAASLALKAQAGPKRSYAFVAGCGGGAVTVLKGIYLVLPVAFWIAAAAYGLAFRRASIRSIRAATLWWALGFFVPVCAGTSYFIWHGGVHPLYENVLLWPVGVLKELPPAPFLSRLADGVHWFGQAYRPLVILALPGACFSLARCRSFLVPCLLLWCLVASITLLIQTYSGWQYHFLLFSVPCGLLAAEALDYIPAVLRAMENS